ncbi:GNAT family N-acetyltransferase [Deinococcus geothermalis]|uniref:NH2-acetyltransferase n=1 Tax=Deinococcus geothermalis (strain DSM 11300 / CIP 105573 / AG-3a) TaxID=319795 RepID=Q1J0K1_DEIGD|nr:GNAT family N-acetyltransferase [Deinococcus geothermalis]ABF44983.1 NH2-acetyltransferase [Deinococcus geothermalis DSM 11300]
MTQDAQVINNEAKNRYEIRLNGQVVGRADYQLEGDTLIFTHTEVEEGHEGQGLGSELVGVALDDARTQGLQVVPACPFVAAFIREHPEYADLVPQEGEGGF